MVYIRDAFVGGWLVGGWLDVCIASNNELEISYVYVSGLYIHKLHPKP